MNGFEIIRSLHISVVISPHKHMKVSTERRLLRLPMWYSPAGVYHLQDPLPSWGIGLTYLA